MNIENYKPVIATNEAGEVFTFNSKRKASRVIGVEENTILYRIRTGKVYKGWRFRYATEEERAEILKGLEKEEKDEDWLDPSAHTIPYETKYGRVCITPCPFRDKLDDLVYVGSSRCLRCGSNKGRDRKTQQVACNRRI